MRAVQTRSMDFYDAVISDDGIGVARILNESITSKTKISVRVITGMLVIAVENKFIEAVRAILAYNSYSSEKIIEKHLDAILCFAAKSNLLKELKITYH